MASFAMMCTISAQTQQMPGLECELTDSQKAWVQQTGCENADEKFAEMTMTYYVPQIIAPNLHRMILNREINKARCSIVYRENFQKRVKSKLAVDNLYKDSINTILIPFNNISGENIGFVLRLCQRDFCKKDQLEKIMKKALDLTRELEKDPRKNVWNDEMDFLDKVLSKNQLDAFFELKTLNNINNDCNNAWNSLLSAGLTEQVDSVKERTQVYAYFKEVNKIREQYRYRENLMNKNLEELYKHRPYAIRLLDGIYEKKNVKENNVGSEFVW